MSSINLSLSYAVSAIINLAKSDREWLSTEELALRCNANPKYLVKIMRRLAAEGFVDGQRGPGRGFRLRPEALRRTLVELMDAIDTNASVSVVINGEPVPTMTTGVNQVFRTGPKTYLLRDLVDLAPSPRPDPAADVAR